MMKDIRNYIIILLLGVFAFYSTFGQQDPKKFESNMQVHIGDTFSGSKRPKWMRGEIRSINWKSWHDKVIILDFFDTYCPTCIQSMPHLQQLQSQFGNKIQILNVTWQDKATLEKFFATNEYLKEHQVNLPVIYNDMALRSMFPYQSAPHVAIIYRGKVQAITFSRLLTAANIKKLIQEGRIDLPLKNDFGRGDLMVRNDATDLGIRLSGYQNGIKGQSLKFEKDSLNNGYKTSIYNRSIYTSLVNAWGKIKEQRTVLRPELIVWNVPDSNRFKNFTNSGEAWDVEHAISYERIDRLHRSDAEQAEIILQDLHSLLGIRSYWSNKLFKCLVLTRCPVQKSDKVFANKMRYHGTDVFSKFMAFREDFPLVYDEAMLTDKLEIGSFESLDELNEQLRQYGLELVDGEAEFETFVIEEEQ